MSTPDLSSIPCINIVNLAVGVSILLYDHALTLYDEVKLVWRAPCSFSKYGFLANRYLVLACLLSVAYGQCIMDDSLISLLTSIQKCVASLVMHLLME